MDGGKTTRTNRRRRTDRGASLVEFAIIMPVLFMIMLGTITGGMTLSRQNSVKNGVREAGRFGAVLADFDDVDNRADLYAQVVAAATGDLDVGAPNRVICVALIDDDNTWDYSWYGTTATPSSGSDVAAGSVPTQCRGPAADPDFDATVGVGTKRIWVRAERTSEIQGVLFSLNPTLESHALTRYERADA